MSPLLRRLRDWLVAPSPEDAATDEHDEDSDEPRKRRRRGRRGGRGRNKTNTNGTIATTASAPAAAPATRQTSPTTSAPASNRSDREASSRDRDDRSRDRRDDRRDRSGGRDDRRRRRPWRSSLEEPLPEDVAFRPPSEGGDRTILPARRRPPPGLHATRRVLVSGSRFVPRVFGRGEAEPTVEAPSNTTAPTGSPTANANGRPAPAHETGSEGDAPKRRRRGRRGGRGRRRSEASDGGTETAGHNTGSTDDIETATAVDAAEDAVANAPSERIQRPLEAPAIAGRRPATEPRRDEPRQDEPAAPRRTAAPHRAAEYTGPLPEAFRALGVGNDGLRAVGALGYTEPTPIQAQAIPALIEGHDVVGVAQTGSGKTVAFGLPLLEACDPSRPDPQAIVLVPTRELAQQVLEVLTDLGTHSGTRVVGLLGGRALDRDFRALEQGPQVVVGTPGRVLDHIKRRTLSLRAVRYAVLDEADEMLDIGFLPDITRILGQTPRARQTALFSATMPNSIKSLVHRYMRDPVTVTVDPELSTVDSIEQIYFEVAERDKMRGLAELVKRELKGRTIVFSKTRRGADRLSERLQRDGIRIGALHGDLDQRQRDRVVQKFRAGELDILVATNVAARGIDIPEITHVVNYDVPQNVEEYVHRVGRTGRMGREGKAITFVCENDVSEFDAIMKAFGDKLHQERLDLYG